jgi:hypothetical protein
VAHHHVVCLDYPAGLEWLVECLSLADCLLGVWLLLIPRKGWGRSSSWCEEPELSLNNDIDLSNCLVLNCAGGRSFRAAES